MGIATIRVIKFANALKAICGTILSVSHIHGIFHSVITPRLASNIDKQFSLRADLIYIRAPSKFAQKDRSKSNSGGEKREEGYFQLTRRIKKISHNSKIIIYLSPARIFIIGIR